MKLALLQLTSSDDPSENLEHLKGLIEAAGEAGADIALTPEVTNCVSLSRSRQRAVLQKEEEDETLKSVRALARSHRIWISLGSLALKTDREDGRFANRSFLIDRDGDICGRYDKIHMFDVDVSATETFRESDGYAPGTRAVLAETKLARIGMTICYDLRFPHLYRVLAQSGAEVLLVPSAFSPVTGEAHWETLLKARAIETGCFVVAAAQTGTHPTSSGNARQTYGHSLVVDPWGQVIVDAGTKPGMTLVEIDLMEVSEARRRIPSMQYEQPFEGPK